MLASLIVKDGAQVMLADGTCPVARPADSPDKSCVLAGSISTDFVSGAMVVVTADNTTWLIPQTQVHGVVYPVGTVRYAVQPAVAILLLGLVGLGACAALRWWRVRRGPPQN